MTTDKFKDIDEIKTDEQKNLKNKLVAYIYYPLQYFIIRSLVFGFIVNIDIITLYNAFNVKGITALVLEFISHLPQTLQAEHYLFIISNIFPYLLRLVWESRNIILYAFGLWQFIIYIKYIVMIHTYKPDNKAVLSEKIGAPASGKSSKGGYDFILQCNNQWDILQKEFWHEKSRVQEYKRNGNKAALIKWREIKQAYFYNITNAVIPCGWSNIPIQYKGEKTSILTIAYLQQKKRLPYRSVLFIDEIGSLVTVEMSKDKPLDISDFFRLCRHFADLKIITTEQCPENVYIDFRRVVGNIEYMLEQKHINKPLVLNLAYYLLEKYAMKKYPNGNEKLSRFLARFANMISYIGARQYKYVNQQSTDMQAVKQLEKKFNRIKTVCLPPNLNYQYNDRTFKLLYKVFKKCPQAAVFKDLLINIKDKAAYLRDKEKTA